MDSRKTIRIEPFPLESEFRVLSMKGRLKDLTREELELFLSEALVLCAKMTHQLSQVKRQLKG